MIFRQWDCMSNLQMFHDSNIEGVLFSQDLTQKLNLQNSPKKHSAFTKDRLFMYSPVFLLRKKSMLTRIFDIQLKRLEEIGLIEFWIERYTHHRNPNKKQKKPSKLRIENIVAAFQICGIMYLISFGVFIFEIISTKRQIVKCFLDYLTH